MGILWEDRGWDDYLYWQTQDKKTLKRINSLIKDTQRDPYNGIGKPEPLKENLSGFWSRRINDVDRLVYDFENENIRIISCRGHYE
ncbi:MAG: Txe/YoeB family addiction module toxin [Pseudobutyrivibrio ruminis]|nr:Txe/YoeB family addiction module toxin [Pseudobutyrivibrio ruminis]